VEKEAAGKTFLSSVHAPVHGAFSSDANSDDASGCVLQQLKQQQQGAWKM